MNTKREFRRFYDTDGGMVHASGVDIVGSATLCGCMYPDNLSETDEPIDCRACLSVIDHVHAHRRPVQ